MYNELVTEDSLPTKESIKTDLVNMYVPEGIGRPAKDNTLKSYMPTKLVAVIEYLQKAQRKDDKLMPIIKQLETNPKMELALPQYPNMKLSLARFKQGSTQVQLLLIRPMVIGPALLNTKKIVIPTVMER